MARMSEIPAGGLPDLDAPAGSLMGNVMEGIPIPSITGGAAAPSSAQGSGEISSGNTYAYSNSGGGLLWVLIGIAGFALWKTLKK